MSGAGDGVRAARQATNDQRARVWPTDRPYQRWVRGRHVTGMLILALAVTLALALCTMTLPTRATDI